MILLLFMTSRNKVLITGSGVWFGIAVEETCMMARHCKRVIRTRLR
jgi:hypothetical protein